MQLKNVIAILINPKLNHKRSAEIIAKITARLNERNISFQIFMTKWPHDINAYKEIWLIGGDGTMNYLLNLYPSINIPIAIFKGGTGNDFAWKLYVNLSTDEHITTILNAKSRAVDAAECNGRIFINGVGIGFDGEVLRSIKMVRLIGGHIGYLMVESYPLPSSFPCKKINEFTGY